MAKELLATPIGFEPTISTVTGWHVRPLHHGAILVKNRDSLTGLFLTEVYQDGAHGVKPSFHILSSSRLSTCFPRSRPKVKLAEI